MYSVAKVVEQNRHENVTFFTGATEMTAIATRTGSHTASLVALISKQHGGNYIRNIARHDG